MIKKINIFTLLLLPITLFSNDRRSSFANFPHNQTGIEINAVSLIIPEKNIQKFGIAYSLYSASRNAELRFPVNIVQEEYTHEGESYKNILFTVDADYRYFLNNNKINGLFVSTHARAAILTEDRDNKYSTKLGAGLGLGYKYMPKNSKFTLGMGIKATRYFLGDDDIFGGNNTYYLKALSDDGPSSVTYEFFHIGYRF